MPKKKDYGQSVAGALEERQFINSSLKVNERWLAFDKKKAPFGAFSAIQPF